MVALLCCAAINFVAGFYILDSPQPWAALGTIAVCLAGLGLTLGLVWLLRRRGRWPAFLPGALLGWGVAAVSEGVCYLSLKNMSMH